MKKDTQKRSRLRRYGRLNTSHFLLLGAEGGGGGSLFVVLYGKGFCNWKKQYSAVLKHVSSCAHRNAIVSQALAFFLQDDTVQQAFARADGVENARKRAFIAKNRTVLERIVNVLMFLDRQGLPLRGHREMMTDSCINTDNIVEALKLFSGHLRPTTAEER